MNGIEETGKRAPADLPIRGHGDFVEAVGAFDVVVGWIQRDPTAAGDEGQIGATCAVEAGPAAIEFELEFEAG